MSSNDLHHTSHDLHHADKRSFFLDAPKARIIALLLVVIGIAAFASAFFIGQASRAWVSLLFNTFFFFCIGLGAMALAAITDVIDATWNRPVRRLQEAFGSFVPVASVLFLVFVLASLLNVPGAKSVYKWVADPNMLHHFWGKRFWLIPNFMYARIFGILVIFSLLVFWQIRQAVRRDKAWMEGRTDDAAALGHEVKTKQKYWSAPILVIYGVLFTFFAFDITMSMAPTWFSTLWGGWSFAVMMQTLMATLLIFMFSLRNTGFGKFFSRQQFHDVGKLMHGFTVFFGYLTYAHILTYWYGNMPEETVYYIERIRAPWVYLLFLILICGFILPLYMMIPKAAKWTAGWTITVASLILVAQWFTNLILMIPEVVKPDEFLINKVPFIEVGLFLGLLGLFLTTFLAFAKKVPMLPVGDPLLQEALSGHH